MFYLHASNKTENLLDHLAALIKADPRESIFDTEYILIQSQGMERMISQYMADSFSSWCNYSFLLPVTFLQHIAEKLAMDITPDGYDREFLTWRIEHKLRHIDKEVYGLIRKYLTATDGSLKRFQLARQLAHIYDQYQLMRPSMLKKWEGGLLTTEDPAEVWQMDLWQRLTADESAGRHRGDLLSAVISALHSEKTIADLPKRVSVFGLHIMPPFFLDYLTGLSRHCDVHLFLLSPCMNYWGDMRKKNEVLDAAAKETAISEHPLLVSLGRQGQEFQNLLLEKVNFQGEFTSYEDPWDKKKPKLLHKLQSDLLAGEIIETVADFSTDDSIRFINCHSKMRELEVLRDHVLDLLNKKSSLQLRDIVVMAPDIQEYAPFIPAVFENIQHTIADRSLHRRNAYVGLFQEFLELFGGRFGWTEVLGLLAKEQVHSQFDLTASHCEQLQEWIVSSGIRWGLSGKSREKFGSGFEESSWQAGLDRMLMGFAIDTDTQVAGILPYSDVEGGEAYALGGLCEFVDLLQTCELEYDVARELPQWSAALLDAAVRLFGRSEEKDFLELCDILRQLDKFAEYNSASVNLNVIKRWFEYSARESRSASGFLKGHLTFCSMLPMRSIPFEAVCVIGLSYGSFPKNEFQATFDLMKRKPLPGDRSVRADDRYQFLEALLAARQNLYISYIGQSLFDNKRIVPSVVVTELLELLENYCDVSQKVEMHPLHGFSEQYFLPDSNLFSYDQTFFSIARSLKSRELNFSPWWHGVLDAEVETVKLADLLSFYANPQLYFVQKNLGLVLSDEGDLPDETETFQLEGLGKYLVDQQILDNIVVGGDSSLLKHMLSQQGSWPLKNVGDLAFEEKKRELENFAKQIGDLKIGKQLDDVNVSLSIGKYTLEGSLSSIHQGGILLTRYAKFRGRDLFKSWILHLAAKIGGVCGSTHLLMRDQRITFDENSIEGPSLETLIDFFIEGNRRPTPLFVEPGIEYCRQKLRKKAGITPLDKARTTFMHSLDSGYEPAWTLLYQGQTVEEIVADDFVALCEQYCLPLWRAVQ